MNYKETGFRALYQRFAAFTLTEKTRKYLHAFPGGGNANCMLTWGYIDPEEGLMLEVIAAGLKTDDGFRFADSNESVRASIRVSEVTEDEFFLFGEDVTEACLKRFGKKIREVEQYAASDEVEQTRQMTFLDASRDPQRIDDVLVYLTRDGRSPEGCRVRITGLGDSYLVGVLVDEPRQDFDYHQGERVAFRLQKLDDGSMICRTDLTPSRKLTKEDLADGSLLAEAIRVFNADRTQENLIEVLALLRDCNVWIPCHAILSDADAGAMEQLADGAAAGEGLQSLTGQDLSNQDEIRLIPDILKSGDALFLPVFSRIEEMGEYGDAFSKISSRMLDAIHVAANQADGLQGIVVNPFTESFVLQTEMFELVEKMKSRIDA